MSQTEGIEKLAPQIKLLWVDLMKGVAILVIVAFHFFQIYPDRLPLIMTGDRLGAQLGFICVDLFFVLAGFNLTLSFLQKQGVGTLADVQVNWRQWLTQRFYRLYPTYWLAIAWGLMFYALANHAPKSVQPLDWILTILGFGGSHFQAVHPGLWFFTVLVEAYLLLPILIKINQGNENRILIFSIILSLINRGFLGFLDHESDFYGFLLHVNYIGSYIFQFSLGIFLVPHYLKQHTFARKLYWRFLLIFVLGASTYIGLSWRGYDLAYRWGFDITSIGFIFLAVQWCCHQLAKRYESHASHLSLIRVPTRFLAASGKNSYQLYLIHQPLLIVVLPVLYQGLTRVRGLSPFAILAGSAVISFGLLILEVWVFGICDRLLAKVIRRRLSPV